MSCGGEQTVAVTFQLARSSLRDDACRQPQLAVLLAVAAVGLQRIVRRGYQAVTGAEQLPQRILRHLFSVTVGFLLHVLAEILLQGAGQFQTPGLRASKPFLMASWCEPEKAV